LHIISDGSHIFSTFYRIRHDSRNQKLQYLVLFLVVIILNSLIFGYNANIYAHYLALFAVYHFARQQYGWFMISSRKCHGHQDYNYNWDRVIIYNSTLTPVLIWMCQPSDTYGWFNIGDLFNLNSPDLIQYIKIFHFLLLTVYFIHEYQNYKKTKFIPLAKYHILTVTWLIWYPSLAYFQKHIIGLILFALSHGIQYMYITFKYEQEHAQNKKIASERLYPILYFIIALIAFFEVIYNKQFSNLVNKQELPFWLVVIGTGFINSFQITHYILDGFLWKPSKDQNISSFLGLTNEKRN